MSRLSPVETTIKRPTGGKVSDGKSMVLHVPASTEIKAGDLVCLKADANSDAYILGLAFSDVTTGAEDTSSVVVDLYPGEVATQKLTEGETFSKGDAVWFNLTTGLLTKAQSDKFAGIISRSESGDATPTAYVLVPNPIADPTAEALVGGQDAIADITDTGKSAVANVAGEAVADLVTDINKNGGIKDVLNAVLAKIDGTDGINEKLNDIIAALVATGILKASV